MWLRDFLSKDLPQCRTMIYGYNSKLSSHGVDTILDYGRELMEEIKKIRNTKEVELYLLSGVLDQVRANDGTSCNNDRFFLLHTALEELSWLM
jgi:hypothetical protein